MTPIIPLDSVSAVMLKHLIVDGYNLLGVSARGSVRVGKGGDVLRETLLEDLRKYQQRMGFHITVVFDAWRRVGTCQSQEHRAGVTVIFSRQGERADDVIQRMARKFQEECVVISSDQEVMNVARAHGALVLRSQEFLPKLCLPPPTSSIRDVDDKEFQDRRLKKKGNPRKLPKSVRSRIRSLGKF